MHSCTLRFKQGVLLSRAQDRRLHCVYSCHTMRHGCIPANVGWDRDNLMAQEWFHQPAHSTHACTPSAAQKVSVLEHLV